MTRRQSYASTYPNFRRRGGFTLVEALVATTLTLILMGAVVQLFGSLGEGISDSRSSIEMTDGLRAAAMRLQADLAGVTVEMMPPRDSDGYFQILEGPATAQQPLGINNQSGGADYTVGDTDDALLFTTRTSGLPFTARDPSGNVVRSDVVEVAWFLSGNKLYRKMVAAYSLSDLTKQESRATAALSASLKTAAGAGKKIDFWKGPFDANAFETPEDVILTNVIGFDVKVFDPSVNDYRDLGWGNAGFDQSKKQYFAHTGDPRSGLGGSSVRVYDTWSTQYETMYGFAGNGLDDNNNGIVDDASEVATAPPYNTPLRGIQVKIRCFEPDSRIIREITIVQDFLPK